MINPMNVSDKDIDKFYLHGEHIADKVYCHDVVYDQKYDGILIVDDIIVGLTDKDIDALNVKELSVYDRLYYGTVYVKCVKTKTGEVVLGTDESGLATNAKVETEDFYGQGTEF